MPSTVYPFAVRVLVRMCVWNVAFGLWGPRGGGGGRGVPRGRGPAHRPSQAVALWGAMQAGGVGGVHAAVSGQAGQQGHQNYVGVGLGGCGCGGCAQVMTYLANASPMIRCHDDGDDVEEGVMCGAEGSAPGVALGCKPDGGG